MRLAIRAKRSSRHAGTWLTQVVPPRTNRATLAAAENMLAALAAGDAFALELSSCAQRREFLARTTSLAAHQQLRSQLSAAYPQAELRTLDEAADPAITRADEQSLTSTLQLRAPAYLPIRTFTDIDLDGERAAQADPVLGIVTALGNLPVEWRGLVQIVLAPAPDNWSRTDARRAVQHPLESERVAVSSSSPSGPFTFCAVVLAMVAFGLHVRAWWDEGAWMLAAAAVVGMAAVCVSSVVLIRLFTRPSVYDMDLVREKVSRVAYRTTIRLSVFAPASASSAELGAALESLSRAFRRYNLATANGFIPGKAMHLPDDDRASCVIGTRASRKTLLTVREIAGLWHVPHGAADVALLERTTARQWLPIPTDVANGCWIGSSSHHGLHVPVAIPADVLQRHALLVAKTRRGKSTLMLRLIADAARAGNAVLLIDPHVDLARAAIGAIAETCGGDAVVYLDVADTDHPFGLNPLDTGLGWSRDAAVAHTLTVFQREWGDRYWGPRMEDAFRFALMTLFDANVAICAADPRARSRQYTLLEVPPLLTDYAFRRHVLEHVTDQSVRAWWADYYDGLDRRFQQEVANPILSKIHRFDGSHAARSIVGQSASTIDPASWVRDRKVVLVSTARGTVGDNAATLIGSTLLNVTALAVAAQANLAPADRSRVTFVVDEFHTIPGADYETILSELGKFGANIVLATQSLARLTTLGRDEGQSLRATVFANLDALFAFNCSAEDAEYLVPELGGQIDVQDLTELGDYSCYARLSSGHRRLPAFSVQLAPPLAPNTELADALIRRSAERYGRPAATVEADRQSSAARLALARLPLSGDRAPHDEPKLPKRRNENRPRKRRRESTSVENAPVDAYA